MKQYYCTRPTSGATGRVKGFSRSYQPSRRIPRCPGNAPACDIDKGRGHQWLSYWVIMGFHSDQRERHTLQVFQSNMAPFHVRARRSLALYLILLPLAAGCGNEEKAPAAATANCVDDGVLAGETYGAIVSTLDWRGDKLECEGMPRPNGEGARLRFAGPATAEGETLNLAFIIALPRLEQGKSARE